MPKPTEAHDKEVSKKRRREEAVEAKPVKAKLKASKYAPLSLHSAVDASKLEVDDVELVIIRVPSAVSQTAK